MNIFGKFFKWANRFYMLPAWLDARIMPRSLSAVLLIKAEKNLEFQSFSLCLSVYVYLHLLRVKRTKHTKLHFGCRHFLCVVFKQKIIELLVIRKKMRCKNDKIIRKCL